MIPSGPKPRDAAYRAIAWQYLVRRAEVEQYEAEAKALRQFIEECSKPLANLAPP